MATYAELFDIITFNVAGAKELEQKVGVASLITADKIRSGNDDVAPFDQTAGMHDKRVKWAAGTFRQPRGATNEVFGAAVMANSGSTQSQILNATDAQIQSAVDGVVDIFATELGSPPA